MFFFEIVHERYKLDPKFDRGVFALKTPWIPLTTDIPVTESAAMPEQSKQQDLAYHIFSVLSFFFDCRDDGACRYRWEEEPLKYFGAGVTEEGASADFHKFQFAAADDKTRDYEYYNQPWFQMCFFLEHNFRYAISGLHYKLFEAGALFCIFPSIME